MLGKSLPTLFPKSLFPFIHTQSPWNVPTISLVDSVNQQTRE